MRDGPARPRAARVRRMPRRAVLTLAIATRNAAYASRLRPRGSVRPVSHERTVSRVTPTRAATSSWLSDRASRSRRSFGGGRGTGFRLTADAPCDGTPNADSRPPTEQKST